MTRIHDRYVLALFARILLFCILALAVIFLLVDLFEKIDDFIDHQASLHDVARFYIAMLPDVSTPASLGRISGLSVALGYVGSICGLILAERVRPEFGSAAAVFAPTALLFLATAAPQFLLSFLSILFLINDFIPIGA